MITKKTVLVLGAGASVHFGYPLGSELINQICYRIENGKCGKKAIDGFTTEELNHFYRLLSRGADDSIDAFLERRPGRRKLGKRLIVDCLKGYEKLGKLFPPNESGWYKTLFTALRQDAGPSPYDLLKNPISIITFNYDRSLESYLHRVIYRHYDVPNKVALDVLGKLKIIHPYGMLGKYPSVDYSTDLGETPIDRICDAIKIISEVDEKPDGFCNAQFREGHHLLAAAERVIFLGFGFHPDNIRRFKYFPAEALKNKEVLATHQLNEAEGGELDAMIKRVAKFGFNRDHFPWRVTCNELFSYRSLV